jgi:hypothetical protein
MHLLRTERFSHLGRVRQALNALDPAAAQAVDLRTGKLEFVAIARPGVDVREDDDRDGESTSVIGSALKAPPLACPGRASAVSPARAAPLSAPSSGSWSFENDREATA